MANMNQKFASRPLCIFRAPFSCCGGSTTVVDGTPDTEPRLNPGKQNTAFNGFKRRVLRRRAFATLLVYLVEMILTCPSSKTFWNVPASWSAWQCVTITPAMRDGLQLQGKGSTVGGRAHSERAAKPMMAFVSIPRA